MHYNEHYETKESDEKNNFYDMTSLFKNIISKGDNVVAFPLSEYWLDIGGKSEYEKAETEFHKIFS